MVRLTRTVRFSINPAAVRERGFPVVRKRNGYGGAPSMSGLGAYYEFDVTCAGEIDPRLGFFVNIKDIDDATRRSAIPLLADAVAGAAGNARPESLLPRLFEAIDRELDRADAMDLVWRLTPFLSYALEDREMSACVVRQDFEFAASHRLHSASLSPSENKAVFGKCNWENGHGHNYRLRVGALTPTDADSPGFDLDSLERVVDETIIERFDHRHLNKDCEEFADLNPSVENIAKVCFELLQPALADAGLRLHEVTVWETEKTSCVYRG
ncbi:MAG: 6-carboxytetrahydropterin synthase [Phycisphaerales bacterium]